MHALGQTLLLGGFSGILALGVLAITRSLSLALALHVGVVLAITTISIRKAESLASWRRRRVKVLYHLHPAVVTAIGLLICCGGAAAAAFGKPAPGPNPLSRAAIVCFGMLFLLLGLGLSIIAATDWIESEENESDHY